ncbi:MAG: amidohydrolase family protein [bacterium]|nr:amidohydrolase family protein [bacterium]
MISIADKYTVIKNGLVLTLDKKKQAGYFNVIIRNGKIFLIDYEKKFNEKEFLLKNTDAEIIDASGKIVMPGFFNSQSVSSYSLNRVFFNKCNYENISSWISLKLIDNYLSGSQNFDIFRELLNVSAMKSVLNGEIFVNEYSPAIKKDFYESCLKDINRQPSYYNLTAFDHRIIPEALSSSYPVSMGFRTDEDLNNYTFSSLKKYLSSGNVKLFIEASLSQSTFDSTKKIFGKHFISVLADAELITSNTVISNPTHLNAYEIEILAKRNSTVLISPSDQINLSLSKSYADNLIGAGVNVITGTGNTGSDILSELKIFSSLIPRNNISYEQIIQTAIYNPSLVFGISNVTGSVERNKSADLILFDISDLRNIWTMPVVRPEDICEFIINNLTVRDISDVIIKGESILRNGKILNGDYDNAIISAKEISSKLYAAGKYFEYREKYLMRDRVDKLRTSGGEDEPDEKPKQEIFVDMVETGEYVGDGEFTILGAKEEDFEKPREREETEPRVIIEEISSLESGLNLFTESDAVRQIPKKRAFKKDIKNEKAIRKEEKKLSEMDDEVKTEDKNVEPVEENETENDSKFQKVKLKFGFKEDE